MHDWVVPDAALARPPRAGVLDAVAGEDSDRAVIHHHRYRHRQLPLWLAQNGVNPWVQVKPPGHIIELIQDCIPQVLLGWFRHGESSRQHVNQCLSNLLFHDFLLGTAIWERLLRSREATFRSYLAPCLCRIPSTHLFQT